jgi:tripartite-type tricarboxylate transporter receptor subunit TctC
MVRAQGLPSQVRIVVGFPPGGGTDLMARVLGQRLGEMWGRTVIVDNRAGAAGVIAAEHVAAQPGDGSTLMMTTISNHAIAPSLYPKLRYDVERDFTSLALVGITPLMLIARSSLGVKSLREVIDRCREQPGKVSFGSSGAGAAQHLALELFKQRAGVDALHVPYKGSGPLLTDLVGGHVDFSFETMTSAAPYVRDGKVTGIAQTRLKRAGSFPNVPTMAEAGVPGYEATTWYGLVAPARMPAAMVQQLNADINKALQMPDIKAKLLTYGAEDGGGTPAAFAEFIRAERLKWERVIRGGNVKV